MATHRRLRIAAFIVAGAALLAVTTPAFAGCAARDSGALQFNNGSGAMGADSDLTWDAKNKRLGIGIREPKSALDVNGDVTVTMILYQSDARLKADVTPLPPQLDKIGALKPVTFTYSADADHEKHLGLIAQEVEPFYLEAVRTADDGMKAVDYSALIAPLIAAVQELEGSNRRLEAEVHALKERAR